ncbi:MAG: radical SAM family heme chaperone HemW [Candidatus Marinimicrobia bacterium]|nr:radical SAM family heme chaperone HemW [Candidatus Neomarinimicrobiota bacterium]
MPQTTTTSGQYIHIPFCIAKCSYCDFYSVTDRSDTFDRLVAALQVELELRAAAGFSGLVDTVYIGGGTPSLLEPRQLGTLIDALDRAVGLEAVREFTVEANPGEAPPDKLHGFRQLGMNRLSLGMQSFQPDLLRFLGRIHNPEDNLRTFEAARGAGFDNISVDLIYNIPGQSIQTWTADLRTVIGLAPEHISAYSLTVEKGTPLHQAVEQGDLSMPGDDLDADMFAATRDILGAAGYRPYETSNFARPGRECRHNLHYWRIEPYMGLGPSAHGFDGQRRYWNMADLDKYLDLVEAGAIPEAGSERLTPEQRQNERLAFGLRLEEGLKIRSIQPDMTTEMFIERYSRQLRKWSHCLELSGGRLRTTANGAILADAIAADFMTESAAAGQTDD